MKDKGKVIKVYSEYRRLFCVNCKECKSGNASKLDIQKCAPVLQMMILGDMIISFIELLGEEMLLDSLLEKEWLKRGKK